MEKIIETKICKHCGATFHITDKDLEFYEKISPVFPLFQPFPQGEKGVLDLGNGKVKYLIPTPTLCPDCRQQRRLSFRNERNLYKRKCSATGEDIISIYSPDKPYRVYSQDFWWSDKWDALDYGPENGIDFSQSFFEQFDSLLKEVPRNALINISPEESEYVNCAAFNKSCYLSFDLGYSEKCFYSRTVYESESVFDSLYIANCRNCYECINSYNLYKSMYSFNCFDSSDLSYCVNCRGCKHCFLCHNLENQKYMIKNISYTKEEYEKELVKYKDKHSKNRDEYMQILQKAEVDMFINCEDCSGAFQKNSKRCYFSFGNVGSEDSKYLLDSYHAKDCYDDCFCGIENSEMNLETLGNQDAKSSIVLSGCFNGCYKVFYSDSCHACSDCFACVGLKNKQYCILNKQYTKEEYEKLVPRIISHMQKTGEWGEFFPASISPFGYNETVAHEYYRARLLEDKKQMITEDGKRYEVNIIGNKNILHHSVPTSRSESLKGKNTFDDSGIPITGQVNQEGQKVLLHGKSFNWSDYEAPFPKVEKIIPASKLPQNICEIPDDILTRAIECEVSKKAFRIQKEELDFYRKHNLSLPQKHPDIRHLERVKLRKTKEALSEI